MKKLTKIVSAVLTVTMLSSVALCAPFTVNAEETTGTENTSVYESNVEFTVDENETNITEEAAEQTEETTKNSSESKEEKNTEQLAKNNSKSVEPVGASYMVNGFTYEVVNNKAIITKYNDSTITSINIPETLGGLRVVEIGERVFYNFSNLSSISVPDTVERIGYEAFRGTAWLNNQPDGLVYAGRVAYKYKGTMPSNTSLKLKSGTLSISNCSFYGCDNLTGIDLGNSLLRIDSSAFKNCTSLERIVIPDSVTYIDNDAFRGCVSLKDVTLSSNLKTISAYTFGDCTSLTSIKIPSKITTVHSDYNWGDHGPFEGCTNLTNITFASGTTKIYSYLFKGCTGLVSINIPNGITTIETDAFMGCVSLKNVSIPNTVTKISTSVFKNCTSLERIVIPDSVTYIDNDAFRGCISLKDVTLSSNLKTISAYTFGDCTSLTSIKIPSKITTVHSDYNWGDHGPFEGCTNLTDIIIMDGGKVIPRFLIKNVPSLKQVIIPPSVDTIEDYAFEYSSNLKKIYIQSSNCNFKDNAFANLSNVDVYCPKFTKTTINLIDKGINVRSSNDNRIQESSVIADTESYYVVKSGSKVNFVCNYKIKDSVYNNVSDTSIKIKIPDDAYISENSLYLNKNICTDFTEGEDYIIVPVTGKSGKITFDLELTTVGSLNTYALFNYKLKTTSGNDAIDIKGNTVYVKADNGWSDLHCYMWNSGSDTNSAWPGVKMDYLGDNIYSCTYNKNYKNVIFNNGSDGTKNQTDDLAYPGDGYIYSLSKSTWEKSEATFISDYDIIDIINEDYDLISLNADDVVSTNNIKISGVAPVESNVEIFVDDEKITTLKSNKSGNYNGTITLPSLSNETTYKIKAVTSDKNDKTISAEKSVSYVENAPELTEFKMYYNGGVYDLLNEKKNSVTFRLENFHGVTPFKFTAKYTNPEKIESVYISSIRNQATKNMKAVYDAQSNTFVAEGFFDESNHDYVPGKIGVQYIKKTDKVYPPENIEDEFTEELPEVLKNATQKIVEDTENHKKVVITLADGETITYSFDKLYADEFIEDYETSHSVSNSKESHSVGSNSGTNNNAGSSAKIITKIMKYGWDIHKEGIIDTYTTVDNGEENKTVYWNFHAEQEYVIKETIDYSKKKAIQSAITAVVGEQSGPLVNSTGFFVYGEAKEVVNYCGTTLDYNMAIAQIMASPISEGEKASKIANIQKLKEAALEVTCAKMIGSYFKFASGFVIAECPPLGLALYAVGFVMSDIYAGDQEFFQSVSNKVKSFFGNPLSFIIDPSGYVYAGVTANRLSDVKVTAYWIPLDETDDDFWDAPDETKSQLWNADEYSQYNPLYTDNDGNYAWDVPEGWWKVVAEKEGYETYTSDWMPVPPPQTDVNINLMSKATPKIESAIIEGSTITLKFNEYMNPETLKNIVISDVSGRKVSYSLEYSTSETSYEGVVYAKEYKLVFDRSYKPSNDYYTVKINDAQSYSGVKTDISKTVGEISYILGDVNGEGGVTIDDVTLIQKYLANMSELDGEQLKAADVTGDGDVSIDDVTKIQKFIAGLVSSLSNV